jgi:hypothetical protein
MKPSISIAHAGFGQGRKGAKCTYFVGTGDDGQPYRLLIHELLSRQGFRERLENYIAPDAEGQWIVADALRGLEVSK